MISFKEYSDTSLELAAREIACACEGADVEYLGEIIDSFAELCDADVGVAFSVLSGCLLVRICDMGRYSFVYPIAICDSADEERCVDAIREYAVREEIPLIITDVPRECLGTLVSAFRHVTADAEDALRSSYRVSVLSELALIGEPPTLRSEHLTLSLMSERHTAEYAMLCRDAQVNKYWGYDFRADVGEVLDEYFAEEAIAEYNRGVALTLAAEDSRGFVGEAVLHAFDLIGGAELGFRILKERQGQGLGRDLLLLATDCARRIGLTLLRARIMKENTVSRALLSQYMECVCETDDEIVFELRL